MHVVRVAGDGCQQMGDTVLLGETQWRSKINQDLSGWNVNAVTSRTSFD